MPVIFVESKLKQMPALTNLEKVANIAHSISFPPHNVTSYATLNNIGTLESEDQTYHTGITVPKSNGGKIVESGKINNPSKQKHDGSLPWLAWRGHINKKLRCYACFIGPDI